MTRPERWAIYLWTATATWTALCIIVPGVPMLIMLFAMLSIVGIPLAFVLHELPTAFLYLTPFLLLYVLLRRFSKITAALVSASAVAAVMFAVPSEANRRINLDIQTFSRSNGGGPVGAPENATIAVLSDYHPDIGNRGCEEQCQRLIFSGTAAAVLRGPVEAIGDPGTSLTRYRFAPARGRCRPAPMGVAHADEIDVGRLFPRPLIQHAAAWRYAEGLCFFADRVMLTAADVVILRSDDYGLSNHDSEHRRLDLRFGAVGRRSATATYLRSGRAFRPVMRRSYAEAQLLTVPLQLDPPFSLSAHVPLRLRRAGSVSAGMDPGYGLSNHLANDLRVRGLTDGEGRPLTLRDLESAASGSRHLR